MPTRGSPFALASLVLVLVAGCGGGADGPRRSPTGETPAVPFIQTYVDAPYTEGSAEGISPRYEEPAPTAMFLEPQSVVEYSTAPASKISSDEGTAWEAGGVQLRPYTLGRLPEETDCEVAEAVVVQFLYFTYLPRGTLLDGPPYQMLCDDGTVVFGGQEFILPYGSIIVMYELDAPVLRGLDLSTGVVEAAFGDRKALLIEDTAAVQFPVTRAAVAAGDGFIYVQANSISSEEVMQVLAGIECPEC